MTNKSFINPIIKVIIAVIVFLNSISGLQIGNVSVNLYFNIIFAAIMLLLYLKNRGDGFKIPKVSALVLFIVFGIISSFISYFTDYPLEHKNIVFRYMISSFVYLIVFLSLYNTNDEFKSELEKTFIKALLYAARIQALWGIIQLVFLYGFKFNINEILFKDILKASNNIYWTTGFFTKNSFVLRITGLNYENAMFAIVTSIGLALEKNKIWRIVFFLTIVLSLSRTGWIVLIIYYFLLFCKRTNGKRKINKKFLFRSYSFIIIGILAVVFLYNNSQIFSKQVNGIIERLYDNDSNKISANRHMLYYPYGIYILLFGSNFLQLLFGYGMRCSGIAFAINPEILKELGGTQDYTVAWAVECDVIGLLLGGGITTTICYYWMMFELTTDKKNPFNEVVWMILIAGVTYHFHSISYIIYVLIFAYLSKYKKDKENNYEVINKNS